MHAMLQLSAHSINWDTYY